MNSSSLWVYRLPTAWMPEPRGFGWKNFLLRLAGIPAVLKKTY